VRDEVERVEGKREWMMQFVGWVEMLGGFLEEKVRSIPFEWFNPLVCRSKSSMPYVVC
jgi:hypothetical protein